MKIILFSLLTLRMISSLIGAENKPALPIAPCCRDPLPPAKYSERSVYSLENTWTSDVGKTMKLDLLLGRPVVLTLFFTKCEHSCPLILRDLKDLESKLQRDVRARTDFVLVTIDPQNDTVNALRAYRDKHNLPADRWVLLRGTEADVGALAEHVGFKYLKGSDYQFGHSVLITILNPTGDIVYQQVGVGVDRSESVKTLENLIIAPRRAKPKKT